MPRPLVKTEEFTTLPAPPVPPEKVAIAPFGEDCAEWAESPARLLHARLVATFSPPALAVGEGTLSPRNKLALVAGLSAMLWGVILLAAFAII